MNFSSLSHVMNSLSFLTRLKQQTIVLIVGATMFTDAATIIITQESFSDRRITKHLPLCAN